MAIYTHVKRRNVKIRKNLYSFVCSLKLIRYKKATKSTQYKSFLILRRHPMNRWLNLQSKNMWHNTQDPEGFSNMFWRKKKSRGTFLGYCSLQVTCIVLYKYGNCTVGSGSNSLTDQFPFSYQNLVDSQSDLDIVRRKTQRKCIIMIKNSICLCVWCWRHVVVNLDFVWKNVEMQHLLYTPYHNCDFGL